MDIIGFFRSIAVVSVLEIALALVFTLLPHLGGVGRRLSDTCTRAPLLDVILAVMMWIPWIIGAVLAGWMGLIGAIVAQVAVVQLWIAAHEFTHRKAVRGPRIVRFLDQEVGWWRNRLALWLTVFALPGFWVVRLTEIVAYPILVRLLGFPAYRHGEWINLSRHKFQDLVGHDLLWCLYCDWMTGVYSMGAEMLRNVESFWCPIRFPNKHKIEHCKQDFPDIETGWVPADGSMQDVQDLLEAMYSEDKRSWFGHPEREDATYPAAADSPPETPPVDDETQMTESAGLPSEADASDGKHGDVEPDDAAPPT
ncbi:MAG: hypothetical protein KAS72_03125 [Phycisphaerales bacterium]|nr:hypothetical protein [Phycisphaerales bacterium]